MASIEFLEKRIEGAKKEGRSPDQKAGQDQGRPGKKAGTSHRIITQNMT